MVVYTSVAAGDWSVAANWSPAGVPGLEDAASVNHQITISGAQRVDTAWIGNGAGLILTSSAHLSVRDRAGAFIVVRPGGGITAAAGARMTSASPNPSYPWQFIIETNGATGARDVDRLEVSGNNPVLCKGLDTSTVVFAPGGLRLIRISPKHRTPVLDYHRIAGRNAGGRTFHRGCDSARMTASGYCIDSAANRAQLEDIKGYMLPVSLTGWRTHMPRGYVEDVRVSRETGGYLYFDLHLVEDL